MECRHCRGELEHDVGEYCPHCGMSVKEPTESDTYFANQERTRSHGTLLWMLPFMYLMLTWPGLILFKLTQPGTFWRGLVVFAFIALPVLVILFAVHLWRTEKKNEDLPIIIRAVTVHEKRVEKSKGEDISMEFTHLVFLSPNRELLAFSIPENK